MGASALGQMIQVTYPAAQHPTSQQEIVALMGVEPSTRNSSILSHYINSFFRIGTPMAPKELRWPPLINPTHLQDRTLTQFLDIAYG
ncbi:hypothetical protein P3T33_005191 [Rhizobium sp. AN67]|nr:hypothetical protein [Rhizobium sp. AN67]SOD50239.1 hypothetical protein SAMN05216595_0057 [Rhizobium sp. AN6A]